MTLRKTFARYLAIKSQMDELYADLSKAEQDLKDQLTPDTEVECQGYRIKYTRVPATRIPSFIRRAHNRLSVKEIKS